MAKLAINGGTKQVTEEFPSWPVFDGAEIQGITEVVKSGKWGGKWGGAWWRCFAEDEPCPDQRPAQREKGGQISTDIPQVVLFQEEFAKYHDVKYAMACANGSVAIEAALKALGIGPGDEVIVPPYTFVTTATSVLHVNAVPIFVDIDPETYNMDPARMEEAITEKTKAVIPVHFAGQCCDMDKILDIAKRHKLYVIEDCAHAHGAEWRGRKAGSLGDLGTFSFQSSKTMTSGEGGVITTNNKDLAIKCHSLIWIGREVNKPWYEFYSLGWNFRLTEFQGAILRAQLTRLEQQVEKRMDNARYLTEKIRNIPGINPIKWDERATKHSFYLYMFRFDPKIWGISRIRFQEALAAEGVEVFNSYAAPIYQNDVFINQNFYPKGCPLNCLHYGRDLDYKAFSEKCPEAERICKEEAIWLNHPMFLGKRGGMDAIAASIQKLWDNIGELSSIPIQS